MAFGPDGQPLRDTLDNSVNWTVVATFTAANFSGGNMVGPGSASIMRYVGTGFTGADVEFYATIATPPNVSETMTLGARLGATASTRYTVRAANVSGSNNDTLALENGAGVLAGPTSVGFDWASGDMLGIRIRGNEVVAWYKQAAGSWVPFLSVTDASTPNAGDAFLGFGSSGAYTSCGGGDHLATPEGMTGLQ